MKVYITAATILEIEPFIESPLMRDHKLLITGIGSVTTAYHLTKMISVDRPQLVIQAGIAGGFASGPAPGTVAIVEKDRFADLGVEENDQWKDLYDLGLANENDEPFHNGWLINNDRQLSRYGLPLVPSITVSEITTQPSRISLLMKKYGPALESMEGAALHFVCLREGIPFIQLRCISNLVGERDKSKWEMKLAIENLNLALVKLIEQLA